MIATNIAHAFGSFAFRIIAKKASKLIRSHGFPESERESLLQDFACNLHARASKFDLSLGSWQAFVVVVCENHYSTLLEHRAALRRARERHNASLNLSTKDRHGETVELGDTIPCTQRECHTGRRGRPQLHSWELQQDLAVVMAKMSPQMRKVCELLMSGTKTSSAVEMGMSKWAFYETLDRILDRFEEAGLREYLD